MTKSEKDLLFRRCREAAEVAIIQAYPLPPLAHRDYYAKLIDFEDRVNTLTHRLLAACETEQETLRG
jgi:hypothetical protein